MKIVYLIHGTWANGLFRRVRSPKPGDWFHPDGPLSQALRSVNDEDIVIRSFCWSGRNSTAARTAAARQLADELLKEARTQASPECLLVAHSHGGTVAMECVFRHCRRLENSGVKIRAVVCMASPFVSVHPISDKEREDTLEVTLGLGQLLITGSAIHLFPQVLHLHFLALEFLLFLVSHFLYVFLGVGSQLLTPENRWLEEYLPEPTGPTPSFHIIRSPNDEASGLLAFTSFLNWTLSNLFLLVHRTPTNWEEQRSYWRPKSMVPKTLLNIFLHVAMAAVLVLSSSEVRALLPSVDEWPVPEHSGMVDFFAFFWNSTLLNVLSLGAFASPAFLVVPAAIGTCLFAALCGQLNFRRVGLVNLQMEHAPPSIDSRISIVSRPEESDGLSHALHSWPSVHNQVAMIASKSFREISNA